ncbi:MAG: hypothetical protein QOI80_64, partial [Solirubrobacteraceae bacterium]|nr:hypothetical protein [Solirubrobacteraceae bacterium]
MSPPDPPEQPQQQEVDLPGLAALAATAALRTAEWSARQYVSAGRRLLDVAAHPDRAPELINDLRHGVREAARELAGEDIEERVRNVVPDPITERWPELPAKSLTSNGREP